jgi:L,D-transpeptidase YcbB
MPNLARLFRAVLLAGGFAIVSGFGSLPGPGAPTAAPAAAAPLDLGEEIAAFYRARGFRPVWVSGSSLRPQAYQLLRTIEGTRWRTAELLGAVAAARGGDPHRLTRADLLLTRAYADHVRELRRPPGRNAMRYIDAGLAPALPSTAAVLAELERAPTPAALRSAVRVNPVFDGLSRGLASYRDRWSRLPQAALPPAPAPEALRRRLGLARDAALPALAARLREFQAAHGLAPTGRADAPTVAALNRGAAHFERLILANIERARAIPARPGGRYVLVDAASARLWMIEDGRIRGAMRVVVGKRAMPTPVMAGLIRYAVLNPYWNLPPDLIRERARKGARAVRAERLQVLSDWSPQARALDPRRVDWRAVAAGRRFVNLRQTPGPHNMMGRIKFMMPNDLGVYLHDTPHRELLGRADRHLSSGCVRVEDAGRLERWLFAGRVPRPAGTPEQRVDLPEPVPVYIAYFTALPTRGGIVFQPDAYLRDQERPAPRAGARAGRHRRR